jgi:hypothetical protein
MNMARPKSRRVELSDEDREFLLGISQTGSHPAQEVRRARILLELDENAAGNAPVPSRPVARDRRGAGRRLHRHGREGDQGVRGPRRGRARRDHPRQTNYCAGAGKDHRRDRGPPHRPGLHRTSRRPRQVEPAPAGKARAAH